MSAHSLMALQRFGLGGRPGDVHAIKADPRGAVAAELDVADAATLPAGDLLSSDAILRIAREFLLERRALARREGAGPAEAAPAGASPARAEMRTLVHNHLLEVDARLARVADAEIGYVERLVAFWTNHFAIESRVNVVTRALPGAFEREAIRPHVLGYFGDMVVAATRHPAMLEYLNGAGSIGPNSAVGQKRGRGLNENHAREILELHTLGVDGGYTQSDVTSLALALTGWTFGRDPQKPDIGRFVFNQRWHEPGAKKLLGKTNADDAEGQAEAMLGDLSAQPATARHVAFKLARHFVADDPPETLVDRLAEAFLDTNGDLYEVSLALVLSDHAWGQSKKLKSPQEFVWSSIRALQIPLRARAALRILELLGQPLWTPSSPEGFKDDAATWLAPDGFADRIDVAEVLVDKARADGDPSDLVDAVLGAQASDSLREAVRWAESRSQALALLLMCPEFQWR